MGMFDIPCEECGEPMGMKSQYVRSKKSMIAYRSLGDYRATENKIIGVKSICKDCYIKFRDENVVRKSAKSDNYLQLIPIITTGSFEDRDIIEYKGVIGTQVVFGMNILKELVASVTDTVGGRSGTLEKVLQDGREGILKQLTDQAISAGANAVIGLKIDLESMNQMQMMHATATAVLTKAKVEVEVIKDNQE
jgi:uncharacterized protein YbjQ (UPF0145 family)